MPPKSPSPDFDFMLKNQPPVKHGLPLFNFGLPRPVKIALGVVGGIILLIIISSVLRGSGGGSAAALAGVLARGQETLRVTQVVQQLQPQDPQTQALAATVNSSLSSDLAQLKKYMSLNHFPLSAAQLAADTDKTSDSAMQAAQQNNNLDGAYISYLKTWLAKYAQDLQDAYKLAGVNGKKLLSDAYDGAQTLLSSAPIKS